MLSLSVFESWSDGHGRVRIALDVASQAFLADHRVGSDALLATVMGLEAMGAAVIALVPGSRIATIEDLTKRKPVLVPDDRITAIDVEVVEVADGRFSCRVVSDVDGDRPSHDEATLVLASAPAPRSRRDQPSVAAPGRVGAGEIYGLYFHGPSFRVLGSADLVGDVMTGHLAADLPALETGRRATAVAPRLIELCLQTAGLWELCSSGRMMIPRSIERITRHTTIDDSAGAALRAVVRARPTGTEELVFDGEVLDADGTANLVVSGYRTLPLRQPANAAAVDAVVRALRRR